VESGLAGSAESEAAGNHGERYGALDDACYHAQQCRFAIVVPFSRRATDPAGSATAWATVHEPVHAPRLRPGVVCDVARRPERFDRADEVADLARTARLL
jgi:hypothetical protein